MVVVTMMAGFRVEVSLAEKIKPLALGNLMEYLDRTTQPSSPFPLYIDVPLLYVL